MDLKEVQLDSENLSCSICLNLLKNLATIPCGHSYCMNCIQAHWDEEDNEGIYSCPQCRQMFSPRPVLAKSFMFAELVEEMKKTRFQSAAGDHCYAGPEDVACDVCTGRKLQAAKSCLVCSASYCEKHLQPHYDAAPLKKHKLVEPSKNLQENICSRHDEVMKIFCRTDQRSICYLCTMDEHKGHETVPVAAERTKQQKQLEEKRRNIQEGIQEREKNVRLLQQQVEPSNVSTDKAVDHSEKIFTELIGLLQKASSDVEQEVRSHQKCEVSQVRALQEKVEQELAELKRKDGELEQLFHSEDHNQFLHSYPSVSALSESTHLSCIHVCPANDFEDVTAAVSKSRDKLQDVLRETWANFSLTLPEEDAFLSQPQPKTRAQFLEYYRDITLDPSTAHTHLILSEGNRKATFERQGQRHSGDADRFTEWRQALSRESLTGRCYWEVEWKGGGVFVIVSYKNISTAAWSNECRFGFNDKSWSLRCGKKSFEFSNNKVKTPVSGPQSSRVGVYLDQKAGSLSFYSVSETMTLLHRVQTTFTQPLYAGVRFFGFDGDTAEFI